MIRIGRDAGRLRLPPRWRRRSNMPASMRASTENRGVLISSRSRTIGLDGLRHTWRPMSTLTYARQGGFTPFSSSKKPFAKPTRQRQPFSAADLVGVS